MELAHRLVSTRRGSTMVAILAAVLAGTLVLVYVARYRNSIRAEAAPVTVFVQAASLIVLDRDERVYRWRTQAEALFGAGVSASS